MATLGSIESFKPGSEDWNAYSERFEQYVIANEIKEEKKIVATFLTTIGSKTYNVLRDLLAPAKPSEVKFDELVKTLRDHYEPKPIIIAERFHFHKREQHEGEGVAVYSAALKKCSEHCAFGTFLEEALRDRFVCGLKSKQTQKRLLAEKSLTWKTAVEIALAMEVADKQANTFRNPPTEGELNYVKPPHPQKHSKPKKLCFRCGEDHIPQKCRFKDETCRICKGKGHIARVCKKKTLAPTSGYNHGSRSDQSGRKQQVRYVGDEPPRNSDDEFKLFQISQEKPEPSIMIPLKVNGKDCSMELDTGASVPIMSEEAWEKHFPRIPLEKSQVKLRTYTGETLDVIGQAQVEITYENQTAKVPLQIVKGQGPSLFGRNWLRDIKLNWGSIKKISNDLDNMLSKHQAVFKDELGTMQGVKAKLFVKPDSRPKFFKPRPVLHALKGAIEQELDRLETMGVIEKVRYSEWAAPIVPVVKPDNSIRVCGDYKVTVNSVLEVDQHPLPNPEELFVTLSGGEKYSKLDLSRAYQQILLDEDSREYVTINTHKGLYRPTHLPFGVSSASAIFQSKIEQVLQGIPMVVCRVDDILVSGKNDQEQLNNLSFNEAGKRWFEVKTKQMQIHAAYC